MKKIYTILIWIGLSSVATAQKSDTLALYNMPSWYYVEDSLDYGRFTMIHYYDSMQSVSGGVWSTNVFSLRVPFCVGEYSEHWFFGYEYWNLPSIDWFAVGAHADTPIRVAGVAMIYPRYKFESPDIHNIREEWISHGCDKMLLQLMDTTMDVQAEGKIMLADSVGKPVFVLNSIPNRPEVNEDGGFPPPLDVYEAWFPNPVTVSDSFYLAFRLEDSVGGFHSVPVPGIYEYISCFFNVIGPLRYDFPAIHWKAHGMYRHSYDSVQIIYDSVENPDWFTYRSCQETHGYMLIFPILAEDCGVLGEVTWAPVDDSSVTLRWNPGTWDSEWEVSYGPAGSLPGDDTVIATATPSVVLHGIAADSHYVAYVRSKCTVRDTTWSDWTDSLSIFVSTPPAPPTPPEGVASVEARAGVDLQPNPVAATALLTAAAPLTAVEVYTAAGTLYKRQPAAGLSLTLDVSSWPSGTYLLLVATDAGTVTRRLVVSH